MGRALISIVHYKLPDFGYDVVIEANPSHLPKI